MPYQYKREPLNNDEVDKLINSCSTFREKFILWRNIDGNVIPYAGLKGREIVKLIGLEYSTVSVGRKRLREKMLNNNSVQNLVRKIEDSLSIIKI